MNLNTPLKDYRVLFLDMNSFFASVEQQVRPRLRGVPIGVAPFTGSSGCIIAASREAKAVGVKIGRIGEARKLCPKLKIVESRPALYMLYHKEIKKVIESFTPYYRAQSVDEFSIFLTRQDQSAEKSLKLGMNLKQAIYDRVGEFLTCSVGIGPSSFLAKMAGERKKPDGLTMVRLNGLSDFYAKLKLTDITGINYRLENRLIFSKIASPTDFFQASLPRLRGIFGHPGRLWYYRLRGYEVDDAVIKNKTIGHSHVLAPEYRSVEGAKAVISKLIYKIGHRLRQENHQASGVSVVIGFMDHGGFSLSKRVDRFSDNRTLSLHVEEILKNCHWRKPIFVAISTFGLVQSRYDQVSIFPEKEKQRSISRASDMVNDHFGAGTVFPASMFGAKESAPDRIPFGSPRYEILN